MGKYFNELKCEFANKSRDEIIEALDIAYQLLDDRDRLFKVIPECPEHGPKCTPYAIEWIKSKFDKDNSITSRDKIAVRILFNLIEELREGINVTRSEEELVEAKRMLKKFLPSELI